MGANDLDSHSVDNLIAGSFPILSKEVIVDTGVLVRGTVLGKITAGAVPTTGTAGGGNTGATTMTGVVGGRRTKPGAYVATAVVAAAAGGLFQVKNPDGVVIGQAEVGTLFVSDEISFTINDPGTDAAIGDTLTVTVPAGSGKYVKVDKAAVNGSGKADCILAEDVDATSADVTTVAYTTGQFSRTALVFAAGNTYADHEADLRVNDIHLVVTVPA